MKNLKYLSGVFLMALSLLGGMSTDGHAITLGLPDISFDTVGGPAGAGLSFDATSKDLHVLAGLQTVTLVDGSSLSFDVGTGVVDYHMLFTGTTLVTGPPNFVIADFVTSSSTPDLLVTVKIGGLLTTLLEGNFVSASIAGPENGTSASGEATFVITAGTLAPDFVCPTPACGGMVSLTFNLDAPLTVALFDNDFLGETKGDIAPVPEPASLILMGSGLVALGFWGRKKKIAEVG